MVRYTIVVAPEVADGGYSVAVPALPGCYTQGETLDEAIANAKDAIREYLADVQACGDPIPEERAPPRLVVVEVDVAPVTRP